MNSFHSKKSKKQLKKMEKIGIGTFYFTLDCGFISDTKIQILMDELGYSAISIYILVIDWLYQERGVLNVKHYKFIAKQLNCDVSLVKKVVEDYELFYFEGDDFSSVRARKDMNKRKGLSKGGSSKGGNTSKNNKTK